MTTITDLPTPPTRSDPSTFATRGDAFLAALPTFVNECNDFAAGLMAGFSSSSTTSLTVGTGSKTLTVGTGLGFYIGCNVAISRTSAGATQMFGPVTAYNSGTGAMTVEVASSAGSGTYTDWTVNIAATDTPELPAQAGNAGKFLTTDASSPSWSHLTDVVYTITDGASVVLDPANGGIQTWTLGATRTCTLDFAAGESMLLMVNDGTAYTLTITGVTWVGGVAPTLSLTLYTVIHLWKVDSVVYGLGVGDA